MEDRVDRGKAPAGGETSPREKEEKGAALDRPGGGPAAGTPGAGVGEQGDTGAAQEGDTMEGRGAGAGEEDVAGDSPARVGEGGAPADVSSVDEGRLAACGRVYVVHLATTGIDGRSVRERGNAQDDLLAVTILDARAPLDAASRPAPLFSSFFKPSRRKAWNRAERVHHITQAMVRDAPRLEGRILEELESVLASADVLIFSDAERALCLLRGRVRLPRGLRVVDCQRDLASCPWELRDEVEESAPPGALERGFAMVGGIYDGPLEAMILLGGFLTLFAHGAVRLRELDGQGGISPLPEPWPGCGPWRAPGREEEGDGALFPAGSRAEAGRGDDGGACAATPVASSPAAAAPAVTPSEASGASSPGTARAVFAAAPAAKAAPTAPAAPTPPSDMERWHALGRHIQRSRPLVDELEEGVEIWLAPVPAPDGSGTHVYFGLHDNRPASPGYGDGPWCRVILPDGTGFEEGRRLLAQQARLLPDTTWALRRQLCALVTQPLPPED